MGRTYEALKRAEAERRAREAREAVGRPQPDQGASSDPVVRPEPVAEPGFVLVEPDLEKNAAPAESADLLSHTTPTDPAEIQTKAHAPKRSWLRLGRSGNGHNGNGHNGNGHNGNGHNGNGHNGNGHNGNGQRHTARPARSTSARFTFDVPPATLEEFQQLRKNLLSTRRNGRSLQLMLMASSRHGEGATTTATLLAATLAQGGRCLVIDANLRTPGLSRLLGESAASGLCEALADSSSDIQAHVHPTEIPNLYVMPTGVGPVRVPYMFEGKPLDDLILALRREFEFILIDGAPIEMYADSSHLAPHADGVILVVQAETTPVPVPALSLRELERVGAAVLGAVLNRTQNYIPEVLTRLTNPQELVEVSIIPHGEASR